MVPPEAVAFPLLLSAAYANYLLGRETHGQRAVNAVRLGVQGILLGITSGISVQFLQSGALLLPMGYLVPLLTIPSLLGLVAIDAARMLRHRMVDAEPVNA